MFKRTKKKIVAAILSVLVLLLFGTLCIIYLASYVDMTNENQELLEQYVDDYTLLDGSSRNDMEADRPKGSPNTPHKKPPKMELSTFYLVAISKSDQVLKVDTADISTYNEDELVELARLIVESGQSDGVENNLVYRMKDKGDYVLVAFLDNTLMLESAGTLINYTLIFGGVSLVLLFFLARYLANRIVAPLEESYIKQKQFVSDAGHELKTPVAVVNANVELLSREIGENQWLSNIQYENERMLGLILQLLDLARAENTTPEMELIDLSRLVCGETLPFESVAFENGLTLNSDISETICVNGNSVQLKQLTSILIDNAIRHSLDGKEVSLVLKKEKNNAVLSVTNDGEEIPPEQRQYLFDRFYRMDTARTGEDKHYGLGLAIAQAITTTHKGTIEVQCRDGKVEFIVKIPLQK